MKESFLDNKFPAKALFCRVVESIKIFSENMHSQAVQSKDSSIV
jgi:hypothetical protein